MSATANHASRPTPSSTAGEPSPSGTAQAGLQGHDGLAEVTAVVLTHRRPRLAGEVTRSLLAVEGLRPQQVVVVVNGEGGLDDPALESSVRMVRLATNLGPAGGFRHGMLEAFSDPTTRWAYLCEDDVGLFRLPSPRLAPLLQRVASATTERPIGAVVAYGRRFTGRSGHTTNVVPEAAASPELVPVDVACWGATLLARAVVDAGVVPRDEWFFGYEDFDFFCRLRDAGFELLVDSDAARSVADQQTSVGRERALRAERPTDADESWRAYYVARNYFALARQHGSWVWIPWHLAYTVRRLQLARSGAERRAAVHGLWDGARGRLGHNPRYQREIGELGSTPRTARS